MAQHSTHRHPPGLSSLPGAELLAEACGVAPTRMVVVFLRDPDGHERCVGVINKLLNAQCCSVISVAREFQCQTQREFFIEEGNRAPVDKATLPRYWGGPIPCAATGSVCSLICVLPESVLAAPSRGRISESSPTSQGPSKPHHSFGTSQDFRF